MPEHKCSTSHAKIRAVGERGAATLKQWHILRKARCSPSHLTATVQAKASFSGSGVSSFANARPLSSRNIAS
jgi:hypothetical protein